MSKIAKSKLKWRFYTGEIENRYVNPDQFKRLHSPLDNILQFEPEYQDYCVTLRPCEEGVSTDGERKAVLYCTENHNRFFDQDKDGFWNEQKPDYCPDCPNKKTGGGANYTYMANYGSVHCHLLIAHAWVENRYNYMVEVQDKKKGEIVLRCTKQIDHRDTNTLNNNANNLEYVTLAENRRRVKIASQLRKAAINPKLLTPTLCRGIYTLPEGRLGEFIGRFLFVSKDLEAPMDVMSIRLCVATALDWMEASAANINC